ncbi:MAG: MoaD/ThiS family protein [Polyangiales bacterium]
MSIEIRIPPALRSFTGGSDEVTVEGADVRAAIDALENAHPGIKERICGADGKVLRFVNLFVGEEDIRMLDGLDSVVPEGETLSIIPAMAGGR